MFLFAVLYFAHSIFLFKKKEIIHMNVVMPFIHCHLQKTLEKIKLNQRTISKNYRDNEWINTNFGLNNFAKEYGY